MKPGYIILTFCICLPAVLCLQFCREAGSKKRLIDFNYEAVRDSIRAQSKDTVPDTQNIFDSPLYDPAMDTSIKLLKKYDSAWRSEIATMEQVDTVLKLWKKHEQYSPEELEMMKKNLVVLDSFFSRSHASEHDACRENGCLLYLEIIKSKQMLYLYLDGELKDSFMVSTGIRGRETPSMSVRPNGPLLLKYTSKKFPGGNYNGMGNMPYAFFIRGGYAIHGTTAGNIKKLGTPASHGCIRLHPVNARLIYELVKRISRGYTWVTIKD